MSKTGPPTSGLRGSIMLIPLSRRSHLCLYIISCLLALSLVHQVISGSPQLLTNRLTRHKRQTSNGSSSTVDGNPNSGSEADSSEEKAAEEILSSFKCDFGNADSADLCKFKVHEPKGMSMRLANSWTHGSGKLALYQGGPLTDASGANDTSGGYMFYETSNPLAMNQTERLTNLLDQQQQSFGRQSSARHPIISSPRLSVADGPLAAELHSPNLTASGPSGMCLSFQYAIKGLSAEELRISVLDLKSERSRPIWSSSESAASNWTRGEVLYSVGNKHQLVFAASGSSTSSASGSSAGGRDQQQRKFRGYIALDEIELNKHEPQGTEGACKGHCNFDGDLCGWTNAENQQEDDFDWSFGRGSDNLFTGPPRDYVSSTNNELTGSYLYTDAGYPRRPGDRATLVSAMFQPTAVNEAMCMRFAVHMFGSGIGSLAIKIRHADDQAAPAAGPATGDSAGPATAGGANGQPAGASPRAGQSNDLVIWEMSGDAGNSWHQAQTSVSSSKSPFQVLIEGVVGENNLGNIAIDEISFSQGPCPTSPPIASKNYGDCTFEQSMCYWRNPDAEIHLDDLDWIRTADEQSIHGPNFDHTLKKRSGSYLKLENTYREPKSGTRAFLLSPIFQPKAQGSVQCLSFYYYMFMRSIGSSGPNLGTIRVYLASNNELVPIWRLTNPISSPSWKHARASLSTSVVDGQPVAPTKLFQIAFEGIWGDAQGGAIALDDITVFDGACDIMPPEAKSVAGECTFDTDMCSWLNKTSDVMSMLDSVTDIHKSPFLQSVNSAAGLAPNSMRHQQQVARRSSWQLATVDSRPVNLQDHTYKAPIGYVYVDVLDSAAQRIRFPLEGAEVMVASGQQVSQCLSFWFAAFGRQDSNQLSLYLTQASAPAPDDTSGKAQGSQPTGGSASNSSTAAQASGSSSGSESSDASETENANAWKRMDGKLLWSISLRNISEPNRRKWIYGQAAVKADSNYIARFVALSSDGGFALDDISYYDGSCETRPSAAKVQLESEES